MSPAEMGGGSHLAVQAEAELQPGVVIGAGDQGPHRLGRPQDHVAGVGREAHGDFLEVGFRIQQGWRRRSCPRPSPKPDRFGKLHPLDVALAVGGVFRSQNHGDEGVPLHLHGGGEAVARLAGALPVLMPMVPL